MRRPPKARQEHIALQEHAVYTQPGRGVGAVRPGFGPRHVETHPHALHRTQRPLERITPQPKAGILAHQPRRHRQRVNLHPGRNVNRQLVNWARADIGQQHGAGRVDAPLAGIQINGKIQGQDGGLRTGFAMCRHRFHLLNHGFAQRPSRGSRVANPSPAAEPQYRTWHQERGA